MPTIRDVGASSKINMLIFADPGAGKTTLIGTGGKQLKTLLIRPPFDHVDPILGSGVKETIVRDWTEMLDVQEYLRHEGEEWDWVWLDSISLFQDAGLDDRFAAAVENKPSRANQGPDKPEYRVNMWRLEQWVRHTVGAELFNLGITAHPFWMTSQSKEDPDEVVEKLMPWIQGKSMPQKICGYMNIVGYYEVSPTKDNPERRMLYTKGNNRYYAKDQFDALGKNGVMVDPTMPQIAKALEGKRAKEEPRKGRGRPATARRQPVRTRRTRRAS
jgi:hypothetical protein